MRGQEGGAQEDPGGEEQAHVPRVTEAPQRILTPEERQAEMVRGERRGGTGGRRGGRW